MSLCSSNYMAKRNIHPSRHEQKPQEDLDLSSSCYILCPASTVSGCLIAQFSSGRMLQELEWME